jgi:hypothetical protein
VTAVSKFTSASSAVATDAQRLLQRHKTKVVLSGYSIACSAMSALARERTGDNPQQIAGRLTKKLRLALTGKGTRPVQGFSGPMRYKRNGGII